MHRPSAGETLRAWLLSALVVHGAVAGNPDAKRLYDDLLSNYNKLVRPVVNTSDVLRVCIKLKLSQLIDVLSSKSEFPEGPAEKLDINMKKLLKSERDILSLWNKGATNLTPEDEMNGRRYTCSPSGKTYEDFNSYLVEYFPMKNVENKISEICDEDGSRTSKTISQSQLEECSRQKDSRSRCLKSKRKSHKINRSEGFRKKFKNVDSMKEFKKILENFRIISEEDFEDSSKWGDSSNIVPAYFVLKLAEDPEKKPTRRKSQLMTNQSFKLIFANDEEGTCPGEKFEKCLSLMTDRCVQTAEEPFVEEELQQNSKHVKTNQKRKNCSSCSKLHQEFKFQREFNASLLEQIKNLVVQLQFLTTKLSVMMEFPGDIPLNDNGGGEVKRQFFQDIWKIKNPANEIFKANLPLTDITCCCLTNKDLKSHHLAKSALCKSCQLKKLFEKNSQNLLDFLPDYSDQFHSSEAQSGRIRRNHPCEKNESKTKSLNYYHVIHRQKSRKDAELKENKTDKLKGLLKGKGNKCSTTGEGKGGKKDFEEDDDSDCDDCEGDVEYDDEKTESVDDGKKLVKEEKSQRFNSKKRFCEDQVQTLDFHDTDYESYESEIYSKETALKLSSRASSRRALVKSDRSKSRRNKMETPKKNKLGFAFHNFFSNKKSTKC